MIITRSALGSAASQIRSTEAALTDVMEQLTAAGVWSGPDADRYRDEWKQLISNRLLRAAAAIEAVQLTTMI